ncbi:hypothetical protein [Maribacter dokdonensis]|uniref:hypothetical protein n=1 Tax=Maribacter dokdonensis TaxID=320912 RepID=UPI00071990BE|nr:hypothetical protein [Maribacter dokdonensis]
MKLKKDGLLILVALMDLTQTQSLRMDFLIELNKIIKLTRMQEKQLVTMPKRNTGFWAKPKGLCIFIMSLNLWDLALDKKK